MLAYAYPSLTLAFSAIVSGGVTTAHQVPAVSQSAYSPPTPETPDSIMSTPPQTHLTKSLAPTFSAEQSIPTTTGLPPTQPTTKVKLELFLCSMNSDERTKWREVYFNLFSNILLIFSEKRCKEESRHDHPNDISHADHEHHGCQLGNGWGAQFPTHPHFSRGGPQHRPGY